MRRVVLSSEDWSTPADFAVGFTDRLLGNLRSGAGTSVVLRAKTVHSFGQRQPIEIVGLDRNMRVVAARTLPPNRIVVLPAAKLIVELPAGSPLPGVAARVVITDV